MRIFNDFRGVCCSVLCASSVLLGTPVASQENDREDAEIEEIVVTAQKRAESLQSVPISVTAFSAADVDSKNLTSLQSLDAQVPGLTVTDNGLFDKILTIRGVGNEAGRNRSTIAGVAFHVDGVFIASASGSLQDFLDVERIEILRGPQGTVFGQNATGGAINVITRQPVIGEFSGHADLQVGSYDHQRTRAYVNVPISDTTAARAAFQYLNHESFTENLAIPGAELDNADNASARFQFLWQPADTFQAILRAQFLNAETGDRGQKNVLDPTPDPRELRQDFPATFDFESRIYSAELNWDLSWASIKSITSYQDDDTLHRRDGDRSNGFYLPRLDGPFQDAYTESWTQEINIRSLSDRPRALDWIAGVFYYDSLFHVFSEEFSDSNGDGIADRDTERGFSSTVDFNRDSWSAYGQATYHLTDAFRITAGARYTEGDFRLESFGFPAGPVPVLVSGSSDSEVTGRANIELDLRQNSMLYGGWSRGYKPGGANTTLVVGDVVPLAFGPTIVDAYEIGVKNRFFDQKLQLNVAGYFYDYENLQFLNDDPIPFRGGVDVLPKAEIYGVDLETSALLTDSLRIDASFSYIETEITGDKLALDVAAYQPPQQALLAQGFGLFSPEVIGARQAAVQNVNGNSLPKTPKYIANITLSHQLDMARRGELTSSVSYQYKDSYQFLVFNNPQDEVPSNDIVDLHFLYEPYDAQWYMEFAVYNVTDDESIQSLNTDVFGVGATSAIYVPPRQFLVRLGYDF